MESTRHNTSNVSMESMLMNANDPNVRADFGEKFFKIMLQDLTNCGQKVVKNDTDRIIGVKDLSVEEQAAYALGYNLAGTS